MYLCRFVTLTENRHTTRCQREQMPDNNFGHMNMTDYWTSTNKPYQINHSIDLWCVRICGRCVLYAYFGLFSLLRNHIFGSICFLLGFSKSHTRIESFIYQMYLFKTDQTKKKKECRVHLEYLQFNMRDHVEFCIGRFHFNRSALRGIFSVFTNSFSIFK